MTAVGTDEPQVRNITACPSGGARIRVDPSLSTAAANPHVRYGPTGATLVRS